MPWETAHQNGHILTEEGQIESRGVIVCRHGVSGYTIEALGGNTILTVVLEGFTERKLATNRRPRKIRQRNKNRDTRVRAISHGSSEYPLIQGCIYPLGGVSCGLCRQRPQQ